MEEEEHVGPGSHDLFRSFWPGTSSGPCPSVTQPARTGAAAMRPSTRVIANEHHILTSHLIVRVIEPLSFWRQRVRGRQASACRAEQA